MLEGWTEEEVQVPKEYFPAVDSQEVEGKFDYHKKLLVKESQEKGEYVYDVVIGIYTKAKASSDISWQQLKPTNTKAIIRRFPASWDDFNRKRAARDMLPDTKSLEELVKNKDTQFQLLGIGVETLEELAKCKEHLIATVFGAKPLQERAKALVEPELEPETTETVKKKPAPKRAARKKPAAKDEDAAVKSELEPETEE